MNSWEMEEFTAIDIHKGRIEKTFVVPMYQRGFVWKPKQEEAFIDTLKRGLPFGTILLYRDDEKMSTRLLMVCNAVQQYTNLSVIQLPFLMKVI